VSAPPGYPSAGHRARQSLRDAEPGRDSEAGQDAAAAGDAIRPARLQPGRPDADRSTPAAAAAAAGQRRRRRAAVLGRRAAARSWLAAHPAWPVTALLGGYPLWWALGFGDYSFILFAIPMAARMYAWHTHKARRLRAPSGFGLWALFLICVIAGGTVLTLTAPGTIATPVANRVLSFSIRTASYLAVTVLLLYVGNLTEQELPRRRIAWLLGLVGLYTVGGGLAGMVDPGFRFSSPVLLLLPHSAQSNLFVQAQARPSLAQVQDVLGVPQGRPDAPFAYTNTWGNCLALLLPWLIAAWFIHGSHRQRVISGAALVVVLVPVVYTLDRGLWIALIFSVLYLSVRLAARGRVGLLGTICAALVIIGAVVLASPLQNVISQRLSHGKSNAHRASLAISATRAAEASPIIGYGDTRHQQGSVTSIAVGKTASCPQCGQVTVGNNGQLWLLFITNGFVGAALYIAFFGYGVWRYRRDRTVYGLAGVLTLLLGFIFMIAYDAVVAPLGITMLAYALLWRSDMAAQQDAALASGRKGIRWQARTPSLQA
jgi:hypothetical protein